MAEQRIDITEAISDDEHDASSKNQASKTAPYFTTLENGDHYPVES